jgi:hypothetical protein
VLARLETRRSRPAVAPGVVVRNRKPIRKTLPTLAAALAWRQEARSVRQSELTEEQNRTAADSRDIRLP